MIDFAQKRSLVQVRGTFLYLMGLLLVPNLPFLIARNFVPANRSYLSVDYVLLGLLGFLVPPGSPLLTMLIGGVLALDTIYAFSGIYYFGFVDGIAHLRELPKVAPGLFVPILTGLLIVIYAVSKISIRLAHGSTIEDAKRATALTLFFLALSSVISVAGSPRTSFLGSSTAGELRQFRTLMNADTSDLWKGSATHTFLDPLLDSGDRRTTRVVLILEESLGESIDQRVTQAVLQPLLGPDVTKRYNVSRDLVPFTGPTELGEIRELCRAIENPVVISKDSSRVGRCLPWRLKQMGYTTTAIHGYSEQLFERASWYPKLGFEKTLFKEQLRDTWGNCAGSFPGACDKRLAGLLKDLLVEAPRDKKQFIYWLTLNSHLPVKVDIEPRSDFNCKAFAPEVQSAPVCNVLKVQYETNKEIAEVVTSPDVPPTVFILVGDHAPPFIDLQSRELFDSQRVPAVILSPRAIGENDR